MAETSTKTPVCTDCGQDFDGSPRAKRCDACRAERKRTMSRERMQAWRAAQPKVESVDFNCRDCNTPMTRGTGRGEHKKKLCDPCLKESQRISTLEYTRRVRAEAKATRPPRICLDCDTDISDEAPRALRCVPCRQAKNREYQRQLREARGSKARTFECARCDTPLDKTNGGRFTYCPPCGEEAKLESIARAEAKRTEARDAHKATHCHYCGDELPEPYHPGKYKARCFKCKRQWHYAYMRARTTATRSTSAPCPDCGTAVPVKRKGPSRPRCGPCALKAQRARWIKYAEIYRHMRRAWKKANVYERFSPKEIYDRDDWRCGVCRKKISQKLRHPNPLSVSLDHKIALANGGPHTRRNTQPAHLRCNIRKNKYDALPGEQMPLPIVF